jgi:hypothetical protein
MRPAFGYLRIATCETAKFLKVRGRESVTRGSDLVTGKSFDSALLARTAFL